MIQQGFYNRCNKIYNCFIMGCGSGQKEASQPVRLQTVTGKLKITITSAHIFHQVSMFKMDPYVVLKLSNQIFTSKVAQKGDKQPSFMESHNFYINSCFKKHGRSLQVTLMDKKKVSSDAQIGFGIADLDPVVNFKKPKDQFRCFVNYDRKQAGFVNIIAQFQQQPAQTLSFRFQTASIRRKTSTIGSMNVWVKAVIGQQVLQTTKQQDKKQLAPCWAKQILTFNVPKSTKQCQIFVMDDDTQVGRFKLQLEPLFAKTTQQSFNQQFNFNNEINAGSLKFQTLVGTNPMFSEAKMSHPKTIQTKKDQPKKEQPKKQQPKKEDSKNQQPKKV